MKKIVAALVPSLALCGALLSGCGAKANQAASAERPAQEQTEPALKPIGTEAEGENVRKVTVTNDTGKDITGFAVIFHGQDGEVVNMLSNGDTFLNGEQRIVYYDMTDAIESARAAGEQDPEHPTVSVQIVFGDGGVADLHEFPLDDAQDLVLKTDGTIYYVEYTKSSTGEAASTQATERGVYDEGVAAAKPDEEIDQAEAASAAQAQVQSQPTSSANSPSSSNGGSGSSDRDSASSGVTTSSGGSSSADDGCIDENSAALN